MREPPVLDARLVAVPVLRKYALLINPFYLASSLEPW
jgi:hypothetical protein